MSEFFDLLLLMLKPGKFKIFLINIMSLEAMNNSLSFRLTQGLEDRLNSWVPQQILLSCFCVPTMHSESIAPNMKQSAWELFVRNLFFFFKNFCFSGRISAL